MSDNWVVRNLENALETWNDKLTEIWGVPAELKTDTPCGRYIKAVAIS